GAAAEAVAISTVTVPATDSRLSVAKPPHTDHLHTDRAPHPSAHDPLIPRRRRSRGRRGSGTGPVAPALTRSRDGVPAAVAPHSEAFRALGVGDTAMDAIA